MVTNRGSPERRCAPHRSGPASPLGVSKAVVRCAVAQGTTRRPDAGETPALPGCSIQVGTAAFRCADAHGTRRSLGAPAFWPAAAAGGQRDVPSARPAPHGRLGAAGWSPLRGAFLSEAGEDAGAPSSCDASSKFHTSVSSVMPFRFWPRGRSERPRFVAGRPRVGSGVAGPCRPRCACRGPGVAGSPRTGGSGVSGP